MWPLVALALSFGVAPALPTFEGNAQCPTTAEVAAELGPLLAPDGHTPRSEHVALTSSDGALDIELRGAAGERLARRRLPRLASCDDLAAAAAVVIASWLADVPAMAPTVERRRVAALRYDVAALFLSSLDPGFAPGALVDATLAPARSRWGARIGALAGATRDQPIGSGHAAWTRAALLLGPRLRLAHKSWLFDFDASVALALLYARGSGFAADHSSYNFDPGVTAGARVGVHWGPVAPVLGVAVAGWLRRQQLDVDGAAPTSLPQWDILLSTGLAVGTF